MIQSTALVHLIDVPVHLIYLLKSACTHIIWHCMFIKCRDLLQQKTMLLREWSFLSQYSTEHCYSSLNIIWLLFMTKFTSWVIVDFDPNVLNCQICIAW